MDSLLWSLIKDAINEGILVTDLHLHVLDINRNLEIMLELDPWRGKEISTIFSEKVLEVINQVVRELEETGVCLYPRRINFVSSKGVMLPLLVTVDLIVDKEGNKVGYLFVFRDAIIQDEISALSWMNTVKTAYISEVAKDFYLPFHNLDRNLDDYIDFYGDQLENKNLLLDAQKELKKLREVFEKFLEYSRIDVVCEKIVFQNVKLSHVLHQALLLVVADRIENRIIIEGDAEIVTDAFKLEQLFVSLIDEFMKEFKDEDQLRINVKVLGDFVAIDFTLLKGVIPNNLKDLPSLNCDVVDWRQYQSLEKNLICWILSKMNIRAELLVSGSQEILRLLFPREL